MNRRDRVKMELRELGVPDDAGERIMEKMLSTPEGREALAHCERARERERERERARRQAKRDKRAAKRGYGPICSLCSQDWDSRLDYCPDCEKRLAADDE